MGKKQFHFGVLFSSITGIENTCQCKIWEGIAAFAQTQGINLTGYLGTYQHKDESFDSHYKTCFNAIQNNSSLDGLIMLSGFIAEDMGIDNFIYHIEELPKNLPLISISFPMEGIPSVLVDNEKGMHDVVEHLIKHHNRKKIVFVKGPAAHAESDARFLGYKKALSENGLPFDEKYVFPGNFSRESGRAAVSELIDKRKIPFDAIAASDDETIIGVMKELSERGICVPSDVIVAGFDDDVMSDMHIPSITTARQPFYEIGKIAAETLCQHIAGELVPETCYVSPELIVRQSCGCLEQSILSSLSKKANFVSAKSIQHFVLQRITSYFPTAVPITKINSWMTALLEKITAKNFSREDFLHIFDEILVSYYGYSSNYSIWYGIIGILFEGVELHKDEVSNVVPIFSALNVASTLVHNISSKEERHKELSCEDARWVIRKSANKLSLTFDIEQLGEKLMLLLPELSINTAFIGLYKESVLSNDFNADRSIDRVIGFVGDKKIITRSSEKPMSYTEYYSLYSSYFDKKPRATFFMPLFFSNEELGVLVIPYNDANSIDVYETLRINFSTAVKGAELLTKVEKLSITDELTGLLNRRGFFQFSYKRLPYLCRRSNIISIVLFMDMDDLKQINDNYGHAEGDKAIAICARLLREVLREEDIIGRIGGDEFVAFVSVEKASGGADVVRRIRRKFDDYNNLKNHPYSISCSVGTVLLEEKPTREKFDLAVKNADDALYEEKKRKKRKGIA